MNNEEMQNGENVPYVPNIEKIRIDNTLSGFMRGILLGVILATLFSFNYFYLVGNNHINQLFVYIYYAITTGIIISVLIFLPKILRIPYGVLRQSKMLWVVINLSYLLPTLFSLVKLLFEK